MNPDSSQLKDSCSYAVEIAKQFLTLACASIAFVIGLATAHPSLISSCKIWLALVMLAVSVLAGLVFLMKVVGHINGENDYNIYGQGFRWLAIIQIGLFAASLVFVGFIALQSIAEAPVKTVAVALPAQLKITFAGKTVEHPVYPHSAVEIDLKKGDDFKLTVQPKPSSP